MLAGLVLKDDMEYYIGKLPYQLSKTEWYERLSGYGWQLNKRGYVYEGQMYQYRQIVDKGKHEYHIRLYEDGTITGHFSLTPEKGFIRHLLAIGSRVMTREEVNELLPQMITLEPN